VRIEIQWLKVASRYCAGLTRKQAVTKACISLKQAPPRCTELESALKEPMQTLCSDFSHIGSLALSVNSPVLYECSINQSAYEHNRNNARSPDSSNFCKKLVKTSPKYTKSAIQLGHCSRDLFCRGCKAKNTPFLVDLTFAADRPLKSRNQKRRMRL